MGSTASSPNRERSDPWWPIENANLDLNPNAMDPNNSEVGQQPADVSSNNIDTQNSGEHENSVEENSSETANRSDPEVETPDSSNATRNGATAVSKQQSLEEFKEELRIKREMRTNAIAELRNEVSTLRQQLAAEKEMNKQLVAEQNNKNLCEICSSIYESLEVDAADTSSPKFCTLYKNLADLQLSLQNANAEILSLTTELVATKQQTKSLKEVIAASKEIIEIRETELSQLKRKFKEIENSLADRELQVMSENLRQEYDRQLANIRNLRALYEERARVSAAEKENLLRQLETCRTELNTEVESNKTMKEHVESLDADIKSTTTDLYAAKEQVTYYKAESKNLHEEMAVINQLFGQLLAGFQGNNNIDIDKLTLMLEENRDLIKDITSKESCKEGASQIPKLIFDLVSQADGTLQHSADANDSAVASTSADEPNATKMTSAQEIIGNLPKVWKVLIELLNHQKCIPVKLKENNQNEFCYKSVQTPTGPQQVLSVSKTLIRLKDLIVEKKFLQRETKKLKNLNEHLESRLNEKEQRLSAVTIELNKTWTLAGRMQRQHRQLHTQGQVLRYQLQQKRRMLSEIKEELEYCRRKWDLAKEKNNASQSQWETLRLEFSKRKESDLNNSGESGYSDSPASEEDDDDEQRLPIETRRNSRSGKKLSIEKFLLESDQKDRKINRNHSVSPKRTAVATVSLTRRNSDSHITQYATEEFQSVADEAQSVVQTICLQCGESCIKHSVHFDADPVEKQEATDHVKISEAVVRNPTPAKTNAQKLVEAKASTSKTKMCSAVRQKGAAIQASTSQDDESLEDMFLRLSGSGETKPTATKTDTEIQSNQCESDEASSSSDFENRQIQRLARIERLEGQCKQLIKQVTRASNRGDELNKRIDDVHSRFTPVRETESNQNSDEPQPSTNISEEATAIELEKPQASTSESLQNSGTKTDEQCLSVAEQEYLKRRDERLKRLEAESQAYINRVKSINGRATDVETKLAFLHGRYGSESDTDASASSSRPTEEILPESPNEQDENVTSQSTDEPPSNNSEESTE